MPENPSGPKGAKLNLDKLNEAVRGKIRRCPLCGALNSFSVLPDIMELRQHFHDGNVLGGSATIVPVVVLTCSECSNTVLINALLTNAIEKETDSQG